MPPADPNDASAAGGAPPSPNTPPAAPPPAATVVLNSDVTEGDAAELVKTKRQLAEEKRARKAEQTRLAELEDENRRLKTIPTPPPPPVEKKRHWLSGATYFDEATD